MTRIFYIIEQEDIMAKLIGFCENFRGRIPTFKIKELKALEPYRNPYNDTISSYIMIHDGPEWSIGYQQEVRFFLDDGTFVDFEGDYDGQIRFLNNYIVEHGGVPVQQQQKLEIATEVEFMDI